MGYKTTEQNSSRLPQPLTRRNAAGEVYHRLAAVDKQIQEALSLGQDELRGRLEVCDEASPAFLKEESLAYLVRHYHKEGNQEHVKDLAKCLLTRCATWIDGKLSSLRDDLKEDGNASVVAELFTMMLDLASDRGDFLQVRFWVVLEKLTVNAFRKQVNQHDLESTGDYDRETIDVMVQQGAAVIPPAIPSRSVESEAIDNVLIEGALHQLKEPLRSAFLLRHFRGWPIEDTDPTVQTISRHFGKTPRTIRNWLSRANELLEAWQGEQK